MKHPGNFVDLSGKQFHSWTVENLAYSKGQRLYWNCRCRCGNRKVIRGDSLKKIEVNYCSKCKPRNTIIDISELPVEIADKVRGRTSGIFMNAFVLDGDAVYGYTSNQECFLFSRCDLDIAKQHTWTRKHLRDGWYVYTTVKQKFTYFHTVILETEGSGMRVDHINRDKLDNRRENLRICTDQENSFNKELSIVNTSGYKGVSRHCSGRWIGTIIFCRRHISLGPFDTREEAAAAYDYAARLLFGRYAYLNADNNASVPLAGRILRRYVLKRCYQRLKGWSWENNPEILEGALSRIESETEKEAA